MPKALKSLKAALSLALRDRELTCLGKEVNSCLLCPHPVWSQRCHFITKGERKEEGGMTSLGCSIEHKGCESSWERAHALGTSPAFLKASSLSANDQATFCLTLVCIHLPACHIWSDLNNASPRLPPTAPLPWTSTSCLFCLLYIQQPLLFLLVLCPGATQGLWVQFGMWLSPGIVPGPSTLTTKKWMKAGLKTFNFLELSIYF